MNREIKFRFWDTVEMQYDVPKSTRYLKQEKKWIPMQYTGCIDRDKKPIYEGDILQLYFNQKVEVRFIDGCFQYYLNEKSHKPFDKTENMNCQVIGNIYENSDLLS